MNAGISFSPFGQQGGSQNGQSPTSRPTGSPVQDAIKLLSLKLPQTVNNAASPLVSATPTALGPQLGNAIADNWLKTQFGARTQPVQAVHGFTPQLPEGQTPDLGAVFSQLLQSVGVPNFMQQPATAAAARPSVQLNQRSLDDLLNSIGGGTDTDRGATLPPTTESGGWNGNRSQVGGGRISGLAPGNSFTEFTMQQPSGGQAPSNGGFEGRDWMWGGGGPRSY